MLVREDGSYLYTLPSVVDDIDSAITHVIRGEDHVANTAPQIQLFEALGADPPAFGHHNLLVGADGQALSKRERSLSIEGLREEGLEALARGKLRRDHRHLGSGRPACEPRRARGRLLLRQAVARAGAVRSGRSFAALNAKLLHALPFDAVAERLKPRWASAGARRSGARCAPISHVLSDAKLWWQVVNGPLAAGDRRCIALRAGGRVVAA